MERKTAKRKLLRRKYKRYVAAVAGAAVMAGAVLPGIPVAKAAASARPTPPPMRVTQGDLYRDGWHEHKNSWPSPDENQAWYQDGHIYYRSDNYKDRDIYVGELGSPVDVVKDFAGRYGFNRYTDTFNLLYLSSNKAYVQAVKSDTGKQLTVGLVRTADGDWSIDWVRY